MAALRQARLEQPQVHAPRCSDAGWASPHLFGVDIEGARYLAQVSQLHATKSSMVWMRFDADNKEVFAPHNVVKRWLISDEEAKDEGIEWHGLDDGCSEAESEEDEQVGAAQPRLPRNDGGLRGAVKSGRWQPAAATKTLHAVDSAAWRKAVGAVPSHKPRLHERAPRKSVATTSRASARRRCSMSLARGSPRASASAACAAVAAICSSPHKPQMSSGEA